jgi:hypothetical protein
MNQIIFLHLLNEDSVNISALSAVFTTHVRSAVMDDAPKSNNNIPLTPRMNPQRLSIVTSTKRRGKRAFSPHKAGPWVHTLSFAITAHLACVYLRSDNLGSEGADRGEKVCLKRSSRSITAECARSEYVTSPIIVSKTGRSFQVPDI